MSNIRRINLFGGPDSGKSTVAAFLYYRIKSIGVRIEHVSEYIKMWTYIPRTPTSWDSFYCQAKQITKEDVILRGRTSYIVSDSPVLLQYFYAKYHNDPGQNAMLYASREFEDMYPSLNIALVRPSGHKYDEVGRYESSEEASDIDKKIIELLGQEMGEFETFTYKQTDKILEYVIKRLEI